LFTHPASSSQNASEAARISAPKVVVVEKEEVLIVDARALLTPAQMVERKLISLLKDKLLPVSHVRMTDRPGHWNG
jgi:hypothetical protein